MSEFEEGHGEAQAPEEGLVPLFTLGPQQVGPRTRNTGTAQESQRAVFQRHHTFGYDVRLDGDYQPSADFGGEWGASEASPRATSERSRKLTGLVATLVFLGLCTALLAVQPGFRAGVTSAVGHFFGGSPAGQPQASAPTPTSNVLEIGTNTETPSPSADPSASAQPSFVAGTPAPISTPTPAPISTPPSDAPVTVAGSYTVAASGPGTTTCQAGKVDPAARSCTWQVNIAAGNPLYTTVTWSGPGTVTVTDTDTAGHALNGGPQQSSAGSIVMPAFTNPPATVFVTVSVAPGTTVNYSASFAAHAI